MDENKKFTLKDGRTLGYAEYGDAHGKPVFFFHGWPSSRMHAKRLDSAGKHLKVRIISPDRPGYGNSDFQKDRTLLDWPSDVIQLADALKIKKFVVLGVSGGGPYAAACAYKIPERISHVGIVVGLAPTYIKGIMNGMALLNRLGWSNYQRFPLLRNISVLMYIIQVRYIPSISGFGFRAKQDQKFISAEFKRQISATIRESLKQGVKGAALDLKLYTQDWGFNLKDIKKKVFLWYGDTDKNVSLAMGQYYASQIPDNKLVIYPNEGHFAQITHGQEILKTLTS